MLCDFVVSPKMSIEAIYCPKEKNNNKKKVEFMFSWMQKYIILQQS